MTTPNLAADTAHRPINIEHVGRDQHVVHGVYGLVLVNGRQPCHLTLTWTGARPYTVHFTLTDPASGENRDLHFSRSLLRDGGAQGPVKVDAAGSITFLVVDGTTRMTWAALNQRWLVDYIAATDQLVPPGRRPGTAAS